jgi:hypothetical protein
LAGFFAAALFAGFLAAAFLVVVFFLVATGRLRKQGTTSYMFANDSYVAQFRSRAQ